MLNATKKSNEAVFAGDIFKKVTENIELRKQLIKDTQYIEWLYNFTKRFPSFSDERWIYEEPKSISKEDSEKVSMLTTFFDAVENYFKKNLISANGKERDRWYTVKYKDVYFDIGVCIGQGAFNYVERQDKEQEKYVEFEKIVREVTDKYFQIKQEKLLRLEQLLSEIKKWEVPYEEIMIIVNKILI